jgi:hypothetical protein
MLQVKMTILEHNTIPNRDLGTEYEKEKIKERAGDTDVTGSKDPMSPEKNIITRAHSG